MQGRNSSASVAVQTAGKAASKQPAGSAILPVQAKGEKSQGVLGDRAPGSKPRDGRTERTSSR